MCSMSVGTTVSRWHRSEEIRLVDLKSISLALNIPTYVNLYGYGYQNIYELNELVNINDSRVNFRKNNKRLKRKNR